ncbi:MAG: GGDEF domain-containing protein [Phycisphaerales bacterium]|nr:GGDEF domain-containing protein [Phycisphaerales bacterium]
MSATAPRRRRRRVLTLGPVPPIKGSGIDLVSVSSIFEALGLIASSPARQPIEAILIAPSSPMALLEVVRHAQAIRRVDPTVQICLIGEDGVTQTIKDHIDHHLDESLTAESLQRQLDGAAKDVPAAPPPTLKIKPPAPITSQQVIGDTDLLEALLSDPEQLVPLAIRAIEQRMGVPEITFTREGGGGPSAAPVRRDMTTWGHLTGATPSALEPWSAWLAKWLAVNDMIANLKEDAWRDPLTGAWNRRAFEQIMKTSMEQARTLRRELTVFVFDIDGFKPFNDRFGHEAGDSILRAMVVVLSSVIRQGDHVCRLGGDEFAVVFSDLGEIRQPGSRHPETVEGLAARIQKQINELHIPELGVEAPGQLSISGGLATFPWDGDEPTSLLRIADHRALQSKRRGKNCLTIGPRQD